METGMLWFDNNPKTDLALKVKLAANYYLKKYGKKPDVCFVHPSMILSSNADKTSEITVEPNQLILPNHLWMGVSESNSSKSS